MKTWNTIRAAVVKSLVLMVLGNVGLAAQAAQPSLFIPPSPSRLSSLLPGCSDETGGTFQAGSVNVGGQVDFAIAIPVAAPQGGVLFTVASTDSGIVAAIDPSSGGIPTLFVPEGQTVTTTTFRQIGNAVGRAQLNFTATPNVDPNTGTVFSFSVPVTGWDVGDVKKRFIDANAPGNHCRLADNDPALSTDPTTLAVCGDDNIKAVATDGVTPLLMRLRAGLPGEGCFELVSVAPPKPGRISAGVVSTVHAGNAEQAFSFYFPPDEFVGAGAARSVDVEFSYTPIITGRRANTTRFRDTLTLVRPPVVLMHGLWANDKSWEDGFVDKVNVPDGVTVKGNYEATNAEELTRNAGEVDKQISEALKKARANKIAATKVDYVGHSMGGLLGRLHIAGSGYKKPENLNKGDIRRFVSLNTPHLGTSLANLIVALHNNPGSRKRVETDVSQVIGYGGIAGQSGVITSGAVCDLTENSAGLSQLNVSVPTAHVFTGTGGPTGSTTSPAKFWDSFLASLVVKNCLKTDSPRLFVLELLLPGFVLALKCHSILKPLSMHFAFERVTI